jgi:hypothetical protein
VQGDCKVSGIEKLHIDARAETGGNGQEWRQELVGKGRGEDEGRAGMVMDFYEVGLVGAARC